MKHILITMTLLMTQIGFGYVAEGWNLRQATDLDYLEPDYWNMKERTLKMSGTNLAWTQYINDRNQIMYWDGSTAAQISSGLNDCWSLQISGSNVVWIEADQVMLWHGSPQMISGGMNICESPQISGSAVVWAEMGEIMLWNGSVQQISNSTGGCGSPRISGSNVVWVEAGQIMLWNGSVQPISSSVNNSCDNPQISGSKVVWVEDGNQIMFWNGGAPVHVATANFYWEKGGPFISDSFVTWIEVDNMNMRHQIMVWDGVSVSPLTSNNKRKRDLSVTENNIVWSEYYDEMDAPDSLEVLFLIYVWDGGNLIRLTDRINYHVASSGANVAWFGIDEDYEWQIFLAQSDTTPLMQKLAGDINQDNQVNLEDFQILASEWLKSGNVCMISFPMVVDPGWSRNGQWAFGKPMGGGGSIMGNPDPLGACTGSNVYGVNLNGDYTVAVGGPYYLTTGSVDCSSYEHVELEFARWLNTDTADYVSCKIEVSHNGTDWQLVWANPQDEPVEDDSWQIVNYDISSMAGGQSAVTIRWSYAILSGRAYEYSGWNIDDVKLWGQ